MKAGRSDWAALGGALVSGALVTAAPASGALVAAVSAAAASDLCGVGGRQSKEHPVGASKGVGSRFY